MKTYEITSADTLFDVTLFDDAGDMVFKLTGTPRGQALDYADRHRPPGGASYVTVTGKELKFPFKYTRFCTPRPVSTRRSSNKQLQALIKRLDAEADRVNARGVAKLLKARTI